MDDNNNIMVTNDREISIEEIRNANELKHKNKGYIKLVKNIDNSTQIIKINNEKFIITNTPIRYASWSGDENWIDEKIITVLRKWVYEGGGFIGIGEPTVYQNQGKYFQIFDVWV